MTGRDLFCFIFGAVVGGVVTYYATKGKVQEHLDDLTSEFLAEAEKETKEKEPEKPKPARVTIEDSSIVEYAKKLNEERYDYKVEKVKVNDAPHVIPLAEFGSLDGYGTLSYTYYDDGVITDESDEVVENPHKILGDDYESRFKMASADVVYVRNDILENDYEIVRCADPYNDTPEPKETTVIKHWYDDDEEDDDI